MGVWFISARKKRRKLGENYYGYARDCARQHKFFGPGKTPDTVDGRFEILVLHVFLLMQSLSDEERSQRLDQLVFDAMFRDMDTALRELGTSDTQVGKRIKEMAKAFYGRSTSYLAALQSSKADEMQNALLRNVLAGTTDPQQIKFAHELAKWVLQSTKRLAKQSSEQILRNGPDFAGQDFL